MPTAKVFNLLSEDQLKQIHDLLRSQGFAGYAEILPQVNGLLIQWGQPEISERTLQRRGQELKTTIEKARISREIAMVMAQQFPDDADLVKASVGQLQSLIFEMTLKLDSDGAKPRDVKELAQGLADLVRAGVADKKYRDQVQARADQAVEEVQAMATRGGLSPEAAEQITQLMLGVVA